MEPYTQTGVSHVWVCPECALVSAQQDEASFYRHLEMIHGLKEKEMEMDAESFRRWTSDLVRRAFSPDR
jgi:hypothetical protein